VRVSQQVVEAPETLTPAAILAEENAEVRRIMFARFGESRFLRESGALPVHADDVGDLYRVEMLGDEPLVMVRVLNRTEEGNGSRKIYWLRVPPEVQTARAAVAWSFSLNPEQYGPIIET
jgi:hypothetical protein